jgi:hypothetical protein
MNLTISMSEGNIRNVLVYLHSEEENGPIPVAARSKA